MLALLQKSADMCSFFFFFFLPFPFCLFYFYFSSFTFLSRPLSCSNLHVCVCVYVIQCAVIGFLFCFLSSLPPLYWFDLHDVDEHLLRHVVFIFLPLPFSPFLRYVVFFFSLVI